MFLTYRTVVGRYLNIDGTPRLGYLEFTPTAYLLRRGFAIVPISVERVELSNDGSFSIDLAVTDDTAWLPNGWKWTVEEKLENGRIWYLDIPSGVGSLDITQSYVPASLNLLNERSITSQLESLEARIFKLEHP